jgi:hypothetical protein
MGIPLLSIKITKVFVGFFIFVLKKPTFHLAIGKRFGVVLNGPI